MAMWMAYAAAVAALLAGGGIALERVCEARRWPLRFVWLGALTLAVVIPATASPPERNEGVPANSVGDVEVMPVAGTSPEAVNAGPVENGRGPSGALASFGSRAPLIAWGLASLATLTILAAVLLASARARRRWEIRRIGSEDVYVSHRFGPALVGIARPAIVVPRWVLRLGEAVGVTVVMHEREHARAGDHLALLCAALVAVAFPWNPAIWWMCRRLGAAVEIDCDRRVVASGIPASDYGSLLLGIGAGRPARRLFALNLADSGSLLERRLRTMGRGSGKLSVPTAIMLGGLAAVSTAAACDLPAPTGVASAVGEAMEVRAEVHAEAPSGAADPQETPDIERADGGEDNRIVVRGRNLSPYLLLDSATLAANPLVLLNDNVVPGGLTSLLAMMDTLDFARVGFAGDHDAVKQYGERAAGGAVLIVTEGLASRSIRQAWDRLSVGAESEDALPAGATEQDGWLRIHGRNGEPVLRLGAELAARNPRVQLDGRMLRGGLRSLLAIMDTLDIATLGYYGIPPSVVINTRREGGR